GENAREPATAGEQPGEVGQSPGQPRENPGQPRENPGQEVTGPREKGCNSLLSSSFASCPKHRRRTVHPPVLPAEISKALSATVNGFGLTIRGNRMRSAVPLIRRFLRRELLPGKHHLVLDNDTDLIQAGILDSLALFMLIEFLQDEFATEVRPEDVVFQNFATVNAINNFVMARWTSDSVGAP